VHSHAQTLNVLKPLTHAGFKEFAPLHEAKDLQSCFVSTLRTFTTTPAALGPQSLLFIYFGLHGGLFAPCDSISLCPFFFPLSLFPGLFSDAISLYLADHFAQ
jgi:hypothetical protein